MLRDLGGKTLTQYFFRNYEQANTCRWRLLRTAEPASAPCTFQREKAGWPTVRILRWMVSMCALRRWMAPGSPAVWYRWMAVLPAGLWDRLEHRVPLPPGLRTANGCISV